MPATGLVNINRYIFQGLNNSGELIVWDTGEIQDWEGNLAPESVTDIAINKIYYVNKDVVDFLSEIATPPLEDVLGANNSANNNNIINLADPVNGQDAATKIYVDNAVNAAAQDLESVLTIGSSANNIVITDLGAGENPNDAARLDDIIDDAIFIDYDNTTSELDADNVQDAIDELKAELDLLVIDPELYATPSLYQVLQRDNDADGYSIINLSDPIDEQDAATKNYVDNQIESVNDAIDLIGLSGVISVDNDADGYNIINLLDPINAQDAATKNYVDDQISIIGLSTVINTNNDAGNNNIINLADPVNDQDAVTKVYVDGYIDATIKRVGVPAENNLAFWSNVGHPTELGSNSITGSNTVQLLNTDRLSVRSGGTSGGLYINSSGGGLRGFFAYNNITETVNIGTLDNYPGVFIGHLRFANPVEVPNATSPEHAVNLGQIYSGEYTPTIINGIGFNAVTLRNAYYTYNNGIVNVYITVESEFTSANPKFFEVTIPISRSIFSNTYDLFGHGVYVYDSESIEYHPCIINATIGSVLAKVNLTTGIPGEHGGVITFSFSYKVE